MNRKYLNDKTHLFDESTIIDKSMIGKFYFFKCKQCKNISSKAIYYKHSKFIYSFICTKCTRKNTNIKKFGCENPFQSKEIKEKIKNTTLERYGVTNVNKLKIVRDKINSHRNSHEIFKKCVKTWISKYGVDNPQKDKLIRKKTNETCRKKYGRAFYNRKKFEQTMQKRYGVKNALQISGINHSKRYYYDSIYFDSSWELAYYIWLKDNHINFSYHIETITYQDNLGKIHYYTPDFKIDENFIEIKGPQFFKEGHLYNPYTKEFLPLYEEILKENNVKLIKDCSIQINYVKKKYGAKVFDFFALQTK